LNYLLDTCVISELVKPNPNRKVVGWVSSQKEDYLFLSVLTLGEIQKGISKLSESNKKLRIWLRTDLLERFKGRIVPVDEEIALTWGAIQAAAEQNGTIIPSIDGLIAATGITHNMTVVTRNVVGMEPSGALLFNPWLE
jgi:predicted nucleic acid-binding protein